MEVHGWSGAKAKVTQSYGVDHQLGIGFKNTVGQWSGGGSRKVDLNAGAERGNLISVWAYNRINYRDFTRVCDNVTGPTERRPYSVHSLLTKFTKAKAVTEQDGPLTELGLQYGKSGDASAHAEGIRLTYTSAGRQRTVDFALDVRLCAPGDMSTKQCADMYDEVEKQRKLKE
ncbi:hypothetical protein [Sphaerisporangium rhizosphaerae]|uniref:Uncharacterized protein n=1 Tax=Sphaerisporangium rhizosphaerae TaxID=2269375 RepID=A0ABW2P7K1_9ACTN